MSTLASRLTGRRYQLVARLGQGGMGEVFIAREVGPKVRAGAGRRVAIKTLLAEIAKDAGMLDRFLDEARLSARLDHPNIAKLSDFGEAEGRPFAVFELLDGADLGECLDAQITRGGRVPVEAALAAVIEACRGLEHAHTLTKDGVPLEVVHRDLSPSNLFALREGGLKVLDFGAASGRDRLARTATGMIIGKLEYMSPEQIRGDKVDARTDVFALGLCLWELLTLRRPYDVADERERVRRIYAAALAPVESHRTDLPPALVEAVARATSADPSTRFGSAQAMAQALEPILRGITRRSNRELLGGFYDSCFGPERATQRAERLRALEATLDLSPPEGEFAWEAPPLAGEQVGTPDPAQALVTTRELPSPQPLTVRDRRLDGTYDLSTGETVTAGPEGEASAPVPAAPAARSWGLAVVALVVLGALVLGILIGRAGASLGH